MSEIKGTVATKGTLKGTMQAVYGKDGLSAYEVALKNGFEGTEQEWLDTLHGEQGVSGVYVGSGDMPEDCNVQIDPNGDALTLANYYTKNEVDNLDAVKSIENEDYNTIIKDPQGRTILTLSGEDEIIDANGYYIANVSYPADSTDAATKGYVDDAVANAVASGADLYELIEEITVTEDVDEILRTTEPDGTPYNFKAVTIEFSSAGVTGYSGKQLIEFNDGRIFKGNAEFMSDGRVSIIRGIYCGGLTFYDATWNAPSSNSTTLNQNGYAIVPKAAQENVTKIHIRSTVKAGTVIKIYGVI